MASDLTQNLRINPADLPDEALIFGCGAAMREVRSRIDSVLSSDLPVLIQGESGTGKEAVARFLHTRSNRCDSPFVKLNCAATPAGLAEGEIFGFERGVSPSKTEAQVGLVEIADGGTLFLDEIGDMGPDLQVKLLRLLQDGKYRRIGGGLERSARVRVVCATNVDLQQAVQSGAFRQDLFYRIDMISLRLPALRDRKCDIPLFCEYFLDKLARRFGRTAPRLHPATLHLMAQWNWPGNLRELENWIARAIILGDDRTLGAELRRRLAVANDFTGWSTQFGSQEDASRQPASADANALILQALQANRWNRRRTAQDLNISYRSLLSRLRDVELPQRRKAHRGPPVPN